MAGGSADRQTRRQAGGSAGAVNHLSTDSLLTLPLMQKTPSVLRREKKRRRRKRRTMMTRRREGALGERANAPAILDKHREEAVLFSRPTRPCSQSSYRMHEVRVQKHLVDLLVDEWSVSPLKDEPSTPAAYGRLARTGIQQQQSHEAIVAVQEARHASTRVIEISRRGNSHSSRGWICALVHYICGSGH